VDFGCEQLLFFISVQTTVELLRQTIIIFRISTKFGQLVSGVVFKFENYMIFTRVKNFAKNKGCR
jgi:hypothetical protein